MILKNDNLLIGFDQFIAMQTGVAKGKGYYLKGYSIILFVIAFIMLFFKITIAVILGVLAIILRYLGVSREIRENNSIRDEIIENIKNNNFKKGFCKLCTLYILGGLGLKHVRYDTWTNHYPASLKNLYILLAKEDD